jgi:hypothetical protein
MPCGRIWQVWSTEQASAGLSLSLPWLEQLRTTGLFPAPDVEGADPRWHEHQLRAWLHRAQVRADLDPPPLRELRLLALALTGVPRRELSARSGVRADAVSARLLRAALTVVLSVPAEIRAELLWLGSADTAERPTSVSRSLACLVLNGPPTPSQALPRRRLEWAQRRWVDGHALRAIAADCGVSAGALRRALAAADLTLGPERWGAPQVAEHLGWTLGNVASRLRTGTFPTPDGWEGARSWWWRHVIEGWAERSLPHRCPDCGARVAQLPQHQRRHRRG